MEKSTRRNIAVLINSAGQVSHLLLSRSIFGLFSGKKKTKTKKQKTKKLGGGFLDRGKKLVSDCLQLPPLRQQLGSGDNANRCIFTHLQKKRKKKKKPNASYVKAVY